MKDWILILIYRIIITSWVKRLFHLNFLQEIKSEITKEMSFSHIVLGRNCEFQIMGIVDQQRNASLCATEALITNVRLY